MELHSNAIAAVLPATSKDETTYNLGRVLVEADRLVATDGHRLHLVNVPQENRDVDQTDGEPRPAYSLAASDLRAIVKAAPKARLEIRHQENGHAEVRTAPCNGAVWTCDVQPAEDWPAYQNVMPKTPPTAVLHVNARYLEDALRAARKLADARRVKPTVRLEIRVGGEFGKFEPLRVMFEHDGAAVFDSLVMPVRS